MYVLTSCIQLMVTMMRKMKKKTQLLEVMDDNDDGGGGGDDHFGGDVTQRMEMKTKHVGLVLFRSIW